MQVIIEMDNSTTPATIRPADASAHNMNEIRGTVETLGVYAREIKTLHDAVQILRERGDKYAYVAIHTLEDIARGIHEQMRDLLNDGEVHMH
jgi:hypothetical protein